MGTARRRTAKAIVLGGLMLLGAGAARTQLTTQAGSVPAGTVPGGINYQGRLMDNGFPVTGTRSMRFRLYDGASGGTLLWSSPVQPVAVTQGIFGATLSISTGPLSGPAQKYLEVQVDNTTLSPREPLNAVPYALVAKSLEDQVTISSVTVGSQLISSGTLSVATIGALPGTAGVQVSTSIIIENSYPQLQMKNASQVLPAGLYRWAAPGNYVTLEKNTAAAGDWSALTELLRVTSAGSIGLGAAPGYKFDVQGGQINASGGLCIAGVCQTGWAGVSGVTGAGTAGYVTKWTGGSTIGNSVLVEGVGGLTAAGGSTLTVTGSEFSVGGSTFVVASGKVGIGTASPDKTLNVFGTGNNFVAEFWNQGAATSNNGLYVHTTNADPANMVLAAGSLSVMGDGKVGIGTTAPRQALHVAGAMTLSAPGSGIGALHNAVQTGYTEVIGSTSSDTGAGIYLAGNTFAGVPTLGPGDLSFVVSRPGSRFEFQNGSGSDVVVIQDDGRVGIGTTDPANRLDVSGGGMILRSSMTLTGAAAPAVSAAGQGALYFDSTQNKFLVSENGGSYQPLGNAGTYVARTGDAMTGPLTLAGSSVTVVNNNPGQAFSLAVTTAPDRSVYHLYVATTGNVGIGTSVPDRSLAVNGNAVIIGSNNDTGPAAVGVSQGALTLTSLSGSGAPGGLFAANSRGRMISVMDRAFLDYRTEPSGFGTWIFGSPFAGGVRDVLAVNGLTESVGVGTTSPTSKLDVAGDIRASAGGDLILNPAVSGATMYFYNDFGELNVTSGTTSQTLFTVKSGGNVGIGTTNPQVRLHVQGGGDFTTLAGNPQTGVFIEEDSSGQPRIELRGVDKIPYIDFTHNLSLDFAGRIILRDGGLNIGRGGPDLFVSTATGNVGIGTTAPASKLHVLDGDIRVSTSAGQPSKGIVFQDGSVQTTAAGGTGGGWTDAGSMVQLASPTDTIGSTGAGLTVSTHLIVSAGNVGIGGAAQTGYGLEVLAAPITGGGSTGIGSLPTWSAPSLTVGAQSYDSWPVLSGSAAVPYITGYMQNGGNMANNSVATFTGFLANQWPLNWSGGSGFGFRSSVASGTNRWAFYADSANSYFGGNVGIGTTAPATMLDVGGAAQFGSGASKSTFTAAGSLNVPGTVTAASFSGSGAGLTGVSGTDASRVAKAGDAMTGALTVDAAGEILGLNADGNNPAIELRDSDGTGLQPYIDFSTDAATDYQARVEYHSPSAQLRLVAPAFSFLNAQGGSGNIGIGTGSPRFKLDVAGSLGVRPDAIGDSAIKLNTYNDGLWRQATTGYGAAFTLNNGDGKIYISNTPASVAADAVNSLTNRMVIDPVGNVGIGTTSPAALLHVAGDSLIGRAGPSTTLTLSKIGTAGGWLSVDGNNNTVLGADLAGNGLIFKTGINAGVSGPPLTSGTTVMVLTTSGNVGIGTTNPAVRLDVAGDAAVSGVMRHNAANYSIAATPGWINLGTLTLPQQGYNAWIQLHAGNGYNASVDQDAYANLFIRTSNAVSVDANGFCASAFVSRFGRAPAFAAQIKLVANAAGCAATAYSVYVYSGSFIGIGWYSVDVGNGGSWAPLGPDAAADPGAGSATVYVVPLEHRILDSDFSVGGSTLVVTGGNVGVGTASPGAKLDVAGHQLFSVAGASITFNAGGPTIGVPAGNTLAFGTSGIERMRVDNLGSVGVGTAAPGAGLHVTKEASPASAEGTLFRVDSMNATFGGGMTIAGIKAGRGDFSDYGLLNVLNTAGSKLYVRGDGNVGIGTTSPSSSLEVNGDVKVVTAAGALNRFFRAEEVGVAGNKAGIAFGASAVKGAIYGSSGTPGIKIVGANSPIDIGTTSGTDATDISAFTSRMYVDSGGSIGIGRTDPGARLDVKSASGVEGTLIGRFSDSTPTPMVEIFASNDGTSGNSASSVMRVTRAASTFRSINAGGSINASGADYAEWIEWKDEKPEPGTVIKHRGRHMVVSSKKTAAFTGNDIYPEGGAILLAFMGQVPVKVRGKVREGDLIVPNGDGTASAVPSASVTFAQYRDAVGTAWDSSDKERLKTVIVAVGIK